MVVVKDIELYSLCEHHMLPFGKAHVAYIPNGHIVGLSNSTRCGRICTPFAGTERLTGEIRDDSDALNPAGVAVVVEAQHLCMQMRGNSFARSPPRHSPANS